jgi:hypothetical protein
MVQSTEGNLMNRVHPELLTYTTYDACLPKAANASLTNRVKYFQNAKIPTFVQYARDLAAVSKWYHCTGATMSTPFSSTKRD